MIKASAVIDGVPMIIIGLSEGNWKKLRQGMPILVDMRPFGFDGKALIMGGETEEAIAEELAKHMHLPEPEQSN